MLADGVSLGSQRACRAASRTKVRPEMERSRDGDILHEKLVAVRETVEVESNVHHHRT